MTSTPQNDPSRTDAPGDGDSAPAKGTASRKLQDDPRAKLALAKKNQAGNPAAASGGGHAKAAHESSKQGKKEKKVRW
ncbi:hypothetical protein [Arthrobacter sedimenti]|uniref:hypothetical protein n=1 Tax=Arthrobacter sedimenti TaxID=2694931 RepID=UPI000B3572C3|nr:hypothetical protein [Arthrobacter sedimenti]OUM43857.1 hypothetical protein B8W73_04035 [Arthrobacter agilis]